MIEKLVVGEGIAPLDDYVLADKINEIIDHLPQEKECPDCKISGKPKEDVCISCINYCKGERVLDTCPNYIAKQPTKEPQEKDMKFGMWVCPTCGKGRPSGKCEVCRPTKEVPDILTAIKEVMIQLYYEELHPINENTTAEDLKNRKEKAIDEYLGRNQKLILYPILHAKVDKAMAHIAQAISALYIRGNK